MTLVVSNKHDHTYRPITAERAEKLDEMLIQLKNRLPNSEYILGGGNAISVLLRVYEEAIAKLPSDIKQKSSPKIGTEEAKRIVYSWMPSDSKPLINGCYRDSNFVPHILCMESKLEGLVSEAKESGLTLMRRPAEITIWSGKKVESYEPTTVQEIKERSKIGRKDKLSSNALRLVDLKQPEIYYIDLFVHHLTNANREKVILMPDKSLKTESMKTNVSFEEVQVVSNRDQGENSNLVVPFDSFQPIPYYLKGMKFNVANPLYLYRVKEKHHIKKKNDLRDPADLEVLHNILKFVGEDPMSRMRATIE